MAELTTIARPYAEAAFRIARDANALPVWSQMLRFLCATSRPTRRRRRRSTIRSSPPRTRRRCCCPSAAIGSTRLGRNFVRVLVDADRVAVLPQIRDAVRDAEERCRRRGEGPDRQRLPAFGRRSSAELKAALEKRFGKKIEATVNVDPALGGGARITVGDTVIDGTIEAQLAAMATQLRG